MILSIKNFYNYMNSSKVNKYSFSQIPFYLYFLWSHIIIEKWEYKCALTAIDLINACHVKFILFNLFFIVVNEMYLKFFSQNKTLVWFSIVQFHSIKKTPTSIGSYLVLNRYQSALSCFKSPIVQNNFFRNWQILSTSE